MELDQKSKAALYERTVTPHLPAAWNLARWLVRDPHDAEYILQETCMRAFRSLDDYRGGEAKSWLLAIVRNTSYNWLQQNRSRELMNPIDDATEALAATDTRSAKAASS